MAKLLGLLFEVTEIFDMQTRPELVLLQKTMVVVEGVARRLDPEFDMWTTAEPVVRRLDRAQSRRDRPARAGGRRASARSPASPASCPSSPAAPSASAPTSTRWASAASACTNATVEGIGEEVARHGRSQRMALWVIALAAGVALVAVLFV